MRHKRGRKKKRMMKYKRRRNMGDEKGEKEFI